MSSDMNNINYDDFKNICRVCMFDCDIKFYVDHVVSNIYRKLTDLRFDTNDDLPKQICGKCFYKINEINEFMIQCVRTHDALMECLKQKQLNEAEKVQKEDQDVIVIAKRNRNGGELVIYLQKRMEVNENIELNEGIIPEASEIKEEDTDLLETCYNLKEEITVQEQKIEYVNDEHVTDKICEINNEQNIESDDDLFESNTSDIISGSDEDPDYNNTSSDDSDSVSNNENSDVSTENLNFSNLISKNNKKEDSNEKEAKQNKTSESNDCKPSYKCTKCSKSFGRKYQVKTHMRTHTGERPYKCAQCLKSFSRLDVMKKHMRTHTGERPYKCDQCTKTFIESCAMKTHMRTHSSERPFKCDQCPKSFNELRQMTAHLYIHSGERPFKCDQCSKSFTRAFTLKQHMCAHSDERPYKCTQCSKKFNYSVSLKRHMRMHTDDTCDQ